MVLTNLRSSQLFPNHQTGQTVVKRPSNNRGRNSSNSIRNSSHKGIRRIVLWAILAMGLPAALIAVPRLLVAAWVPLEQVLKVVTLVMAWQVPLGNVRQLALSQHLR